MNPERTASSIAQLIAMLSKSGKRLPEPWTPSDLVGLIGGYKDLIAAIQAADKTTKPDQPEEDGEMQHGRPGAYQDLVKRAMERERGVRKPRKTTKQS